MKHLSFTPAAVIIGLLALFSSCIKDDLSDCPIDPVPNPDPLDLRLEFSYVPLSFDPREGFDPKELETLTVYVFDQANTYVGAFTDPSPALDKEDYHISFRLDSAGVYSFYAWGNIRGDYRFTPAEFIKGKTRPEDIRLQYETIDSDSLFTAPPAYFHAALTHQVIPATKGVEVLTLPIVKNTYTIHLTAEGLPGSSFGYQLAVTDNNSLYQFDNSFVPSGELHYISSLPLNPDKGMYEASLTTLRLERDRSVSLVIRDLLNGKTIVKENLVELILALENDKQKIDFSRMYDFDLHLVFKEDPNTGRYTVSIRVNDWQVVEKDVIIDWNHPEVPWL